LDEPLQHNKRLFGVVSNTKGIEGKENGKSTRMEEVSLKEKIDDDYTTSVLLFTRLFAQCLSLFGHVVESLKGCFHFFQLDSC
jgi:hypothetical protein